ncbi:MAG: integrin alpha [Planctomycetes bacterium]|nr:integrin alpha [Planctomycetota bacterium]
MRATATLKRGFARAGSLWILLAAGGEASGQDYTLWQFGDLSADFLGASLAGIGDTDGDGAPDLLVAAPNATRNGLLKAGWAALLSGASGAILWSASGTEAQESLGETIGAVGAVDADGSPDFAVGGPRASVGAMLLAGRVRIHSGATGALLQEFTGIGTGDWFGLSVARMGDLDGDGFDDVVVGTVDPYPAAPYGRAEVFSGATGALLLTVSSTVAGENFGAAVAGVGDVTGDGLPDLAVGAPGAASGGVAQAGEARVFSGSTAVLLLAFAGSGVGDELGVALASAGDLDADGVPDLLAGAREAGSAFPVTAPAGPGYVRAISLGTGSVLYTVAGTGVAGKFGSSLSAVGDVDGDGASEFVAGAPQYLLGPGCCGATGPGYVRVHSGATGLLLAAIQGTTIGDRFGSSVAGAGDLDGDGLPEVAVGAPRAGSGPLPGGGRVSVFSASSPIPLVVEGRGSEASLGTSISSVPDTNGDGYADVVVGSPLVDRVRVLSGLDGSVLLAIPGPQTGARFGSSVAGLGDLDGDGAGDFVVGAPLPGGPVPWGSIARVYSGSTGALVFTVADPGFYDFLGTSVAAAGDLDLDGVPDFAVGAPETPDPSWNWSYGPPAPGYVNAYSGATGALLLTVNGAGNGEGFGSAVAGAGDVDGDGIDDLLVSTRWSPAGWGFGRVALHSGANGALLYSVSATNPGYFFGRSLARAGDLDGDAAPDFVVGAPRYTTVATTPGTASVHSGATGAVLYTLSPTGPVDQFGVGVAGGVDLDGDDIPDILVGSPSNYPQNLPGEVSVFSGATGAPLSGIESATPRDQFGTSIAVALDPLGDGVPDVFVGAPGITLGIGPAITEGYVQKVSIVGTPPGTTRFGSGCAGTGGFAPSIAAFGGTPTAGNADFGIAVTRGRGGAATVLFAGSAPNPGGGGPGSCASLLSGTTFSGSPVLFLAGALGVAGAGYRLYAVPIPANPTLVGATLHFQWAAGDPASPNGSFTTSDGLSVTVQ